MQCSRCFPDAAVFQCGGNEHIFERRGNDFDCCIHACCCQNAIHNGKQRRALRERMVITGTWAKLIKKMLGA